MAVFDETLVCARAILLILNRLYDIFLFLKPKTHLNHNKFESVKDIKKT